jgi:hypothetical protein
VSGPAAEFEHTRAFGDDELKINQIFAMEECIAFQPIPALGCQTVRQIADALRA